MNPNLQRAVDAGWIKFPPPVIPKKPHHGFQFANTVVYHHCMDGCGRTVLKEKQRCGLCNLKHRSNMMKLKRLAAMALAMFAVCVARAQTNSGYFTTNGCVTITWDDWAVTDDPGTFFILHATTNQFVPLVEWPAIASIQANTNAGQVFFPVMAAWFYITLSNAWGESPPSNIIGTPQAPLAPTNLRILRLQQTP